MIENYKNIVYNSELCPNSGSQLSDSKKKLKKIGKKFLRRVKKHKKWRKWSDALLRKWSLKETKIANQAGQLI